MRYEVAARIFFATVRAARHHREFSTLDHHRQNEMLRRGWAAAFVLRAAIWPVDLTDFRKPLGIVADDGQRRALAAARAAISSLRPDRVEFSVLETLVLCRPGKSNRFYDFTSLTPSFAKFPTCKQKFLCRCASFFLPFRSFNPLLFLHAS